MKSGIVSSLLELSGYKKYQNMSFDDLMDELKTALGMKWIGMGDFSSVFHREGDPFVFKVFWHDPPYERFLEYARTHKSPHFPKVYGFTKLNAFWKRREHEINDKVMIAKIEHIPTFFPDDGMTMEILTHLLEHRGDASAPVFAEYPPKKVKMLASFLATWIECVDALGGHMDFHEGNFGARADGTLVILDPMEGIYDDSMIRKNDGDFITGPAWRTSRATETES